MNMLGRGEFQSELIIGKELIRKQNDIGKDRCDDNENEVIKCKSKNRFKVAFVKGCKEKTSEFRKERRKSKRNRKYIHWKSREQCKN